MRPQIERQHSEAMLAAFPRLAYVQEQLRFGNKVEIPFKLLRGDSNEEHPLLASPTVWDSEQAFADWTSSDAFRKAHMAAGQSPRDFYPWPPQLELLEAVL